MLKKLCLKTKGLKICVKKTNVLIYVSMCQCMSPKNYTIL